MDKSQIGRELQAMRKTHGGGRPVKLKRCPKCGGKFSARDVRKPCPDHGQPTTE
jgi:hypothetical protein